MAVCTQCVQVFRIDRLTQRMHLLRMNLFKMHKRYVNKSEIEFAFCLSTEQKPIFKDGEREWEIYVHIHVFLYDCKEGKKRNYVLNCTKYRDHLQSLREVMNIIMCI